jgi:hypothetical protein
MSLIYGQGQQGPGYYPGTGASKSAATAPPTPNQNARSQAGTVQDSFNVVLTATGVPQQGPGYRVPSGCRVRVRANNGTTTGNAQVIFVLDHQSSTVGKPLAPLDDIEHPADTLNKIWIKGTAGDGVVLSVISNAVGG